MWELYSVKVFLLQRDFGLQKISKEAFKTGLRDLQNLLVQIQSALRFHKSEQTFEGKVFELTEKALKSVKDTLCFIDII